MMNKQVNVTFARRVTMVFIVTSNVHQRVQNVIRTQVTAQNVQVVIGDHHVRTNAVQLVHHLHAMLRQVHAIHVIEDIGVITVIRNVLRTVKPTLHISPHLHAIRKAEIAQNAKVAIGKLIALMNAVKDVVFLITPVATN